MVEIETAPLLPVEWELTLTGQRLLMALLRHGRLTFDQAARVASAKGKPVARGTIHVHICNLRQDLMLALVTQRVRIQNLRGWGYMLENLEDARACVREHGGSWE